MPILFTPLLGAAETGLKPADYVIMLVYVAGLLAIGVYLARRQETTEDFFVGGRSMPWWAVGLSMLATLMSTLTYLGSPGEMIKHGIGRWTTRASPKLLKLAGMNQFVSYRGDPARGGWAALARVLGDIAPWTSSFSTSTISSR